MCVVKKILVKIEGQQQEVMHYVIPEFSCRQEWITSPKSCL